MESTIPVWHKAVLSVKEAADYGNISIEIIRAQVLLAIYSHGDFPCFMSGKNAKIPREKFISWLDNQAMQHTQFEFQHIKNIIQNAKNMDAMQAAKVGRPRKVRKG